MTSAQIANAVLIFHVFYVGIVVLSVPLILIGGMCKWKWVQNLWFRLIHLLMIVIVVFESLLGINCPLTVWENNLRRDDGTTLYQKEGFIASWLDRIMFYHFPHWIFTTAYVLFGAVILALFFVVPVKRRL